MELKDLLKELNNGKTIVSGSHLHEVMHRSSQDALRITAELNGSYHEPDEVRQLLASLIGKQVDKTVTMFPPFYTDFGKNTTLGRRVFINSGCSFQDQGGIRVGDDSLIGHNTVLTTLNHEISPDHRGDMHPAPIIIGRNVWIGSNVTILPGVSIGDNAVVAAASVVTKDVRGGTVVLGSPARKVRSVTD